MSLRINAEAPKFTAQTTQGPIDFHEWIGNGWAILFSHPKDFTPVCTAELGYMAKIEPEFTKRGAKLIGLSIDPVENHSKWAADIEETQGAKVKYAEPLVLFLPSIGLMLECGQRGRFAQRLKRPERLPQLGAHRSFVKRCFAKLKHRTSQRNRPPLACQFFLRPIQCRLIPAEDRHEQQNRLMWLRETHAFTLASRHSGRQGWCREGVAVPPPHHRERKAGALFEADGVFHANDLRCGTKPSCQAPTLGGTLAIPSTLNRRLRRPLIRNDLVSRVKAPAKDFTHECAADWPIEMWWD